MSRRDLFWERDIVGSDAVRARTLRTRELSPTRQVWRGDGPARHLDRKPADLDHLAVTDLAGRRYTLPELLDLTEADGLCVLHRGRIVYEVYPRGMLGHQVHHLASQTKSVVGLIAAMLIADGTLSRTAQAHRYVPGLVGTAFGSATINELLHMQVPVGYAGLPYRHQREAQRLQAILGFAPFPPGYTGPATIRDWLRSATATAPPGSVFRYENGNSEAVGWILQSVTGVGLSDLVQELIFSRIGAEQDASFIIDPDGVEQASGGLATSLRDWARWGEMLRCGGAANGAQIVQESTVAGICVDAPDSVAALLAASEFGPANRGCGYHDFFWIENDRYGSFQAHGKHIQRLQVSPGAETVFAQFGSYPGAGVGPGLALGRLVTDMYARINEHLTGTDAR